MLLSKFLPSAFSAPSTDKLIVYIDISHTKLFNLYSNDSHVRLFCSVCPKTSVNRQKEKVSSSERKERELLMKRGESVGEIDRQKDKLLVLRKIDDDELESKRKGEIVLFM